jgi:hypothetical protein
MEGKSADNSMAYRNQQRKEIKDIKVWSDIVGTIEKKQWI